MPNKYTLDGFKMAARIVHGTSYDYSSVIYVNSQSKIIIICKDHGEFLQTPSKHVRGQGCPSCGGSLKKTQEKFIEQASKTHQHFYNYTLVEYINNKTKIKIICPIHGIFEQTPDNHLTKKKKCKKCNGRNIPQYNTISFIEKARQPHNNNKYDYSFVTYERWDKKIKILCIKHGVFEQRPIDHVSARSGCPICKSSKGEEAIKNWLTNHKIEHIHQFKFNDLKLKQQLKFDFFLPRCNILIEFNGVQHYKKNNFFHRGANDLFIEQTHKDDMKQKHAKMKNIELLIIPFWQTKNIETILSEKLLTCAA